MNSKFNNYYREADNKLSMTVKLILSNFKI